MATSDPIAEATAVLGLMDAVDASTEKARENPITDLGNLAAIKLLIGGKMDATQWAALKTEIGNVQTAVGGATTALAQAAAAQASAIPAQEVAAATTLLQSIATGLSAAVAKFTVSTTTPPTTPTA